MAQSERHNSMGGSSGIDYPRKRTAIACEICRTRRSKCDAKKPACSKCVELDVECVYRKPNLWDREPVTAAATAALSKVDGRLDQIQDSISALTEQIHRIPRSNSTATSHIAWPTACSPQSVPNNPSQQRQPYQNHGPSSYRSFSAAQPPGYRLPNLLSFSAPPSVGSQFTYDTSLPFFTHEVSSGNDLYAALENCTISSPPDFSPQTTWRLQRAFVSGLLRWMPIFDDETCFHHVQKAGESGFSDGSASACLSLMVFAIGSMSVDEGLYSEDPYDLPGFAYLAAAYRILNSRKAPIGDVEHLQCRSLFSMYLNFAIRPVQSWHEINLVTRDCMILLKTNWRGNSSSSTTTLKERVFWVAFLLENELDICLELPHSGIRTFQHHLPLPSSSSPSDTSGMYFFLALLSLRKLLAEVIETVGFKSGHSLYVPIVAIELHNQCLAWHETLPQSLKFPLDCSGLFDLRLCHLRGQLFCLMAVVYWPFVVRCMEDGREGKLEEEEKVQVQERARECLEWCVLHLRVCEGIMMQKTVVSHVAVRAFYAILAMIILTYTPIHGSPPPPEVVNTIKRSLDILGLWDSVPFMKEPIWRLCRFAGEILGVGG